MASKYIMKLILVITGLLFANICNFSQYDILKFQHFDVEDGLSQNTARFIVQDKYGFIWISTFHGLNRYDGYTFKIYKSEPGNNHSLNSNRCHTARLDSNGVLWVQTYDGIFHRYNYETDNFTRFASDQVPEYINNYYNYLRDIGKSYTYKNHKFYFNFGEEDRHFYYTNLITNEVTPSIVNPDDPYSLRDPYIVDIFVDYFQTLWVGTFSNGFSRADLNRKKIKLYENISGDINGLISNNIREIFEDLNGVLWIGTRSNGITRFDREKNTFKHYQKKSGVINSLVSNNIREIYQDKSGMFWFGTKEGLDMFNPKTEKFTNILKGTGPERETWIFDVMEDHLGYMWFASFEGLYKYDRTNKRMVLYGQDDSIIIERSLRFVYEDSKKYLWVGSENGGITRLERINPNIFEEEFISIHYFNDTANLKSLSSNRVYSICEDEYGTIWFGTGNGLNKLNQNDGTFEHFTMKNGIPDDFIIGLVSDGKGYLWLSHKRGITRFNIATHEVKNFSKQDGLQGIEFNEDAFSISKNTGEIFFGGPNGLNAFFPDSLTDNQILPKVYFTDLEIDDEHIGIGQKLNGRIILEKNIILTEKITLTHHEKRFAIEFTGIHYANPLKNQYAYIMEGFDNKWIHVEANERRAVYSNLDAGTYQFKVKAANCDGIWNDIPAILTIEVVPPWWETWLFRIFVIAFIISLAVSFYFFRINQIKRQKEELERKVEIRTHELKEANAELKTKQEEILTQNEEIQQQAEELATQRDALEQQNEEIKTKNEQISKAYDNIRVLSEFGQKVSATLSVEAINDMIYNYVNSLMDIAAFGIGLLNEKKQIIEYHSFFEQGKKLPYFYKNMKSNNSLNVWCLKNRKVVYINNIEKEFNKYIDSIPEFKTLFKPYSVIQLPLIVENRAIGVITVNSDKKNAYTDRDITNLQSLASYISIALDNAHVYEIVNKQNLHIKSSIEYAKTIQNSILPIDKNLKKYFETFIIYRPRDIVSGDFYWFTTEKDKGGKEMVYFAVVDCTGHGVPGAFMSLIGSRLLNEIVNEKKILNPSQILEFLNVGIQLSLRQDETDNNDGMDICLCRLQKAENEKYKLIFSGAKRPLYIYNNDNTSIERISGARKSIGGIRAKRSKLFYTNYETTVKKGDILYLSSDGYVDQNAPDRKKLGSLRLKQLLEEIKNLQLNSQKQRLEQELEQHMQKEEQRDDITFIGLELI